MMHCSDILVSAGYMTQIRWTRWNVKRQSLTSLT